MTPPIVERIESGLTTARDAQVVASIIARMVCYELALREIAIYGTGDAAMRACRALAGDSGHE
ncbi:MAG: hypothetical protein N2690_00365 [Rhodocyclaceae bacterium]|nr:hypothetical protein [Rhodocyclaceae bacterium]